MQKICSLNPPVSLEFVIQIDLEHDNILIWNFARSWKFIRITALYLCAFSSNVFYTVAPF